MSAARKTYSIELKQSAVDELNAGGSADQIAARLKVTSSSIYQWRKALKNKKQAVAVSTVPVGNGKAPIELAQTRDAVVLLRKAKSELLRGIKKGSINDLDNAHLLSLLALNSLQGE
jgi:transposase-like protein